MTKLSIALTELAEKGADVDVLREMLQFVTQRMMDLDVEGPLRRPYGERASGARTPATVTAIVSGRRAPARSICVFRSCVRAATSGFSRAASHGGESAGRRHSRSVHSGRLDPFG